MKEKDVQTLFGKQNEVVGVFELKLCKGTSLPFSAVSDHQIEALMQANNYEGFFHKIQDSPVSWGSARMRFTKPKPFDCFYVKDFPAYVVVIFYIPNAKKECYYIPIKTFVGEMLLSKQDSKRRKSLTEKMCKDISELQISLKNRAVRT